MMLAELTGLEIGAIICTIIFGAGALLISLVSMNKKQEVKVDQPLNIQLIESLVTKEDFSAHVESNNATHRDIFSKIGGVERGASSALDKKIESISSELVDQGKDIAALKKETEIQNQTLSSVQSDIKLILGRLPRNSNER